MLRVSPSQIKFVADLQAQHLLESTTIIITAKHGQSPIDPNRFLPIPGHSGANGSTPSAILGSSFLPDSELNQIGTTEDDVSVLWLKPGASTAAAVSLLESDASADGDDPRTPDIVVAPTSA